MVFHGINPFSKKRCKNTAYGAKDQEIRDDLHIDNFFHLETLQINFTSNDLRQYLKSDKPLNPPIITKVIWNANFIWYK